MKAIKFIYFSLIIVLWSCVAPEVERKPVNIVWPFSPAESKIKFIEEIASRDDVKIEAKGGWLERLIGGGESIEDRLKRPYGVAVDRDGRIYVADVGRVFVFDKEGNLFFSLGEGGMEPGQFSVPAGIAVDAEDRIYVVDQMNGRRVQVFQYLGEKWKAAQPHQKQATTQ